LPDAVPGFGDYSDDMAKHQHGNNSRCSTNYRRSVSSELPFLRRCQWCSHWTALDNVLHHIKDYSHY